MRETGRGLIRRATTMRELAETARRWAAERRRAVLARPITEQGFGPRRPDDALLVDAGGESAGSLYRGAFDARLAAETAAVPADGSARVCTVSVQTGEAEAARLTCGGRAEILLQPLHTVPVAWWDLLADGAGGALITRLDDVANRATSTVVRGVATDEGGGGTGAESGDVARARRMLAAHRAGRDARRDDSGLVLIEAYPAAPHLVIVGGGELADLLTAQAGLLGWNATTTQDAREAEGLLAAHPDAACLVVLSHSPDVDVPTLRTALDRGVPYIGALGSRHTQARRTAELVASGVSEDRLRAVHGPIGLDLGARTPAETALAISAEILGVLGARGGGALRDAPSPVGA
ncbi:XdhC family protein [Streptomyces sp. NPDC002004]